MVQALLNGITQFFLFLIQIIGGIFFLPISALLGVIFPQGADFMPYVFYFLDNRLFPMIKFIIQSLITATHMPPAIFYLLVDITVLRWAIVPALRSILLVYNVYQTAKGVKQSGAS